jgi:single-strand DNA-binding protein
MARSLNKAILIGNLGQDPEIRSTGSGTRVAQLSLATERQWTDTHGEHQKRTEWHRIVAWEKLAEIAEEYLKKGDRVYIEGEIQYRSYEDGEGTTRYVTEIRARELIMLGGRAAEPAPQEAEEREPARSARGSRAQARSGRSRRGREESQPPALEDDDDLPF